MILVHGGGWSGGDKRDFHDVAAGLARQGYVTFSINYRLATETANRWPAQLDDAQRAVRWVRANTSRYGVDPQRLGAIGGSAGGHLVTCLGTSDTRDNTDAPLAAYSSRVACVVDLFGPTDLTEDLVPKVRNGAAANDIVRRLLGGTAADLPAVARDASPLFRVDATSAPFLIFHGRSDDLVPLDNAERLDAALRKAGVESRLIIYDGGHGFTNNEIVGRFLSETTAFFKKHLRP
ncbi:MAG: alpha/beta hydrolase [Terrimicrobiaceae bacterium]|nr:alpha/beta hydrolase [Terrimicrobiaceae bacterium]